MFNELDTIVLSHDIKEYNLQQGDIGTILHCYNNSTAFEVEFNTTDGKTIAVLTLDSRDIQQVTGRKVLHVRNLSKAVA